MHVIDMVDLDLKNKRVLIRVDFNVPLEHGVITSDKRIKAVVPTIKFALEKGAGILLVSHLGRPKEGIDEPNLSLQPVAVRLSQLLNQPVALEKDWINGVVIKQGQIILGENVRFLVGEKENSPVLAKKMASLCDVFIMDAFAAAHRAEASTYGVALHAPVAAAGLLLMAELKALKKVMQEPAKPLTAIVGGSKVSTKLSVLNHLLEKVDNLIVGGGIANTFLAAAGYGVGQSLYEKDLVAEAKQLLSKAALRRVNIPLPQDVVVAGEVSNDAKTTIKDIHSIEAEDKILDIGPATIHEYEKILQQSGTILWNGPVGVFELTPFAEGTKALAESVAKSSAFSVVGGGDTLAAIEKFNIEHHISYISTGGGAFLEFIEGKTLPAIAALVERADELQLASQEV